MKEIKLNTFQLNILLDKQKKLDFQFLLNNGVYCSKCKGVCKRGVVKYGIRLNSQNDIVVDGECGDCGNGVCRIMEFGEDKAFFNTANSFRKSIGK